MKIQTQSLVSPAFLAAAFTLAALVALAGQSVAQESPTGDPTEDDPVLKFAKETESGGFVTAETCSSVIDGGETLDGAGVSSLPVGGGRKLVCLVDVPREVVQTIQDSNGAPWCQLKQMVDFGPNALDERLTVTIEDAPSAGPWSVVATHAGDEIPIIRASGSWPVAIDLLYATADLQPLLGRNDCDEVFGL